MFGTVPGIAFIGPSGAGKSTAAKMALHYLDDMGFKARIVNVAAPIHQIQQAAFDIFGIKRTANAQDGDLLAFLAKHFETEMLNMFKRRTIGSIPDDNVIINGDCRENAAPLLKHLNFKFVGIKTSAYIRSDRLRARGDLNVTANPFIEEDASIQHVTPIVYISNDGTRRALRDEVKRVVDLFLMDNDYD